MTPKEELKETVPKEDKQNFDANRKVRLVALVGWRLHL